MIALAVVGAILAVAACAPAPTPPPPPTPLSVGCHDAASALTADIRFDGPIDSYLNGAYMHSQDGTCSGVVEWFLVTLVVANSFSAAQTKCSVIDPGTSAAPLQVLYGVPAGNYACYPDVTVPFPGCYDAGPLGVEDLNFFNTLDVAENAFWGLSTDGSCSDDGQVVTVVFAVTVAEATSKCGALDPGSAPVDLTVDHGFPYGYYACVV